MKQKETAGITLSGGIHRDDGNQHYNEPNNRVPDRGAHTIGRDMLPWNSRVVVEIEPGFFR